MIIAICGHSKVGKDTFAEPFIQRGFKRVAFADALKKEMANNLKISVAELEANKDKYREDIIKFGEDKRKIDKNYWVNIALNNINLDDNIIITDVRRIPEVEALLALRDKGVDVKLYSLERPKFNGGQFDNDAETAKTFHYVNFHGLLEGRVKNTGTMNELLTVATVVLSQALKLEEYKIEKLS